MNDKNTGLLLILSSVLLIDFGQLFLKYGMNQIGNLDFSRGVFFVFLHIFANGFVLLGVLLYLLSSVGWLFALSKVPLSLGYPILSLGYVVVSLFSWFFFQESISLMRIVGLGTIVVGVFFLSRT